MLISAHYIVSLSLVIVPVAFNPSAHVLGAFADPIVFILLNVFSSSRSGTRVTCARIT